MSGEEVLSTYANTLKNSSQQASTFASTLGSAALGTGITFAIDFVINAISAYMQSLEAARQAADSAAGAYLNQSASIGDIAKRYGELREQLAAAQGSEEETYNVKKQLLDLQTELNEAFGEEYGQLSLITDAYKDHTDAILSYNKEAANSFLNENEKAIQRAEDKITSKNHYNLSYTGISAYTDQGRVLKEIAGHYEDQGVYLLDETMNGSYDQFSIHLKADPQSAYDTINSFENDLRQKAIELGDEHPFDDVLDISSRSLNDAKSIVDDYGRIYKTSLISQACIPFIRLSHIR